MVTWQELLKRAKHSLLMERPGEALQYCDRASFGSDEARYASVLVRGRILLEMGDPMGALSMFESIARLDYQDPEVDCARGRALFELAQFPESQAALTSALQVDAKLADAYYTLGLIAEFTGTGEEGPLFREARRLDPQRFFPNIQMTNDSFEALIHEAVAEMEEPFQRVLEQIPIMIAELPLVNDLHQLNPRISPLSLSMLVGAVVESGPDEGIQPVLFFFKRNVERGFSNRTGMISATRSAIISNFVDSRGLPLP